MRWMPLALIAIALALALGCARHPAVPKAAAKPVGRPLPEWAPKHPSSEFLRAWKVLKPAPIEAFLSEVKSDREMQVARARNVAAWPAHYELFGTLTDEQIQRFLRAKQIRIPERNLTPKQRAAMQNLLRVWRREMKGTKYPDLLVLLYQCGAKEDFSNVDVGFDTGTKNTHMVHVKFWIRLPDGGSIEPCNAFAVI